MSAQISKWSRHICKRCGGRSLPKYLSAFGCCSRCNALDRKVGGYKSAEERRRIVDSFMKSIRKEQPVEQRPLLQLEVWLQERGTPYYRHSYRLPWSRTRR